MGLHGRARTARLGLWRLGALAACVALPLQASDAPAAPKKAAVAAAASAPVVDATADGLAIVQRRLAEKFGGLRTDDPSAASPLVRVTARASATTPPAPKPAAAHTPPARGHAHATHWSYEGEGGPAAWGRLKPEFAACSSGQRQSPIDIRDGFKLALDPVAFDYKPSGFKVHDNGHTIQVNLAPGNSIEVLGQRFELLQFHFHRPSEESIDGKRSDMVAHFVHKSVDGRLAVVAVLIERGTVLDPLQQVWSHLPLEKGDSVAARGTLDLTQLLPEQRGYFTYMGSLTTPPCSEGVLWMVMKQAVRASAEQIGVFARLYPMNARPIQSAAGRRIKESN